MSELDLRTTAKKAPRKTAAKTVRKTAAAKAPKAAPVTRKAPVRETASAPASTARKVNTSVIVAFVVCLLVVGGSIAVGYSDKGPINVSKVIAERRQNATPEEAAAFKTIPVQNQTNAVNGGLVGTGQSTPPPPIDDQATTSDATATSTEATATSTATSTATTTESVSEADETSAAGPATDTVAQ